MRNFRFPTLRTSIIILVLLIVTVCIVVGAAALRLYGQGLQAQAAQAQKAVEQICDEIQSLYQKSASSKNGGFQLDLASVVLELLLSRAPGIEGGVWSDHDGFVAYAFPSYESGPKKDTPQAEQVHITKIAQEALGVNQTISYQRAGERDLRIVSACPLTMHEAVWAMTRVDVQATRVAERSAMGLAGC